MDIVNCIENQKNLGIQLTPSPYKVFSDFPDGKTVVFETKEDWEALVKHFYKLSGWREELRKNQKDRTDI